MQHITPFDILLKIGKFLSLFLTSIQEGKALRAQMYMSAHHLPGKSIKSNDK